MLSVIRSLFLRIRKRSEVEKVEKVEGRAVLLPTITKPLQYIKQHGTAGEYAKAREAGKRGQGHVIRRVAESIQMRNSKGG